jgi:hypothetical protein
VFRLPSQSAEVKVTGPAGQGVVTSPPISVSAPQVVSPASVDGNGGMGSGDEKRSERAAPVGGDSPRDRRKALSSKAKDAASVRLYEAVSLYEEGLIGETDLIFARKGTCEPLS